MYVCDLTLSVCPSYTSLQNVSDNKAIVIEIADIKQSVDLFKVKNCVVQIKGKFTSLSITNAEKTGVVFETAVASVELTNCKSVQVQARGTAPSISIDNTDGATIFLSKECLATEIITCKSINLNISHPQEGQDDHVEVPVCVYLCCSV
jgi:adenylyl cyclase-associated protein